MTEKTQNKGVITLHSQYIKDLSFENPSAPFSYIDKNPEISIPMHILVEDIDETKKEVTLHISVNAKIEEKILFMLELKYSGLFEVGGEDVDAQHRDLLLYVKSPEILFPYARRIISDLTQEGGFPPLFLMPMDFLSLYYNRQGQDSENKSLNIN